ncbi:MAG: hypothetical protein ACRC8M_05130 [Cetobacterium sp.]|uniref:hypothetical protein n=1 Tax=Cetobacterium sp. TaxID=2071632 RepID=UPI003F3FB4CA
MPEIEDLHLIISENIKGKKINYDDLKEKMRMKIIEYSKKDESLISPENLKKGDQKIFETDEIIDMYFKSVLIDYMKKMNLLFLQIGSSVQILEVYENQDLNTYVFLRENFSVETGDKGGEYKNIQINIEKNFLEEVFEWAETSQKFKEKIIKGVDGENIVFLCKEIQVIPSNKPNKKITYDDFIKKKYKELTIMADNKLMKIIKEYGEIEKKYEEIRAEIDDLIGKSEKMKSLIDKTDKKSKKIENKIKKSEGSIITIMGIFVSIFTFISINTQFFGEAAKAKSSLEIIILLLAINIIIIVTLSSLLYLIKKLILDNSEDESYKNNSPKTSLIIGIVGLVILIILLLSYKEKKVVLDVTKYIYNIYQIKK